MGQNHRNSKTTSKVIVLLGIIFLIIISESAYSEEVNYEMQWSQNVDDKVESISISPDGNYIAAITKDTHSATNIVKLYLFSREGKIIWSKDDISCVDVVNSGIYGCRKSKIYFFDFEGNLWWSYDVEDVKNVEYDGINSISVSKGDNYLSIGTINAKAYLFDQERRILWSRETFSTVHDVDVSDDGGYVAVVSSDVRLFDRSGKELWSYSLKDIDKSLTIFPSIESVSISSDGSFIAVGSNFVNKVYVLDRHGNLIWSEEIGYLEEAGNIEDVSISGDDNYILVAAFDSVYLFDRSGRLLWSNKISTYSATAVDISENGDYIAAGTFDGTIYFFAKKQSGSIFVSSTPTGADVYLNDEYKGTTPLTLTDIPSGYYTIKITKSGYEDYLTTVTVEAGKTATITATLTQIVTPTPAPPTAPETPTVPVPSPELEISSPADIQSVVKARIASTEQLLINLYNLVSAGRNIGADVSEAEKKINSAAQLLKEANESYSAAIQKLNQGDVAAALSSANEAYTKGSSGLAMLEESEPILNSAIKKKLEEKLASTESLVNTAKSVGLAFGAEEKLDQAKGEIEKFDEAFASGDLSKADEYVLNADKLLSEINTRIYASFGGVAALVGILAVGVVKVRGRLPRRQPEMEVEATQKAARVEEIIKPEYNPSAKAIAVKNLVKRYKNATILENVSFEIDQGKLIAIVGPSGAGKSTLIEAVAGRLTPDEGEIHILGMDARRERMEINRLVGFVPQHPELYMDQKVWQNMMNSAIKWEVKNAEAKAEEILKQLGIYERKDVPAKNLSGGQLKRLSLAMELIREPPILVLDEPTTGLDPTSRDQIITALSKMVFNHGKTCIFTTHFMDEAEHCDEVIIVGDKGIIAKGSPSELARRMPGMGRIVEITLEEVKEELVGKLKGERGIHTVIREGRVLKIIMDSPDAVEVSQKIKSLGGVIEEARVTKAGMKEVFVHYTGMLPEEAK